MPLPPMKALVAFEAAARLHSFTKAANELHLTHGAVSRQVALLEQHFCRPLFARMARGVTPTEAGRRLYQTVQAMLGDLEVLSRELRDDVPGGEVSISITPSFGSHWLLPRLARFNALHPQVTVQLDASLALARLERSPFDFSVRYGSGNWAGMQAELLFRDTLTPVCRPDLLPQVAALCDGRLELPLLHDSNDMHWRAWLEAAGRADLLGPHRGTVFNDYNLVLDAALNGIGVAMGRSGLVMDLLASGRLVAPLADLVPSPSAFYLVKPRRALSKPAQLLWEWLKDAAADARYGPADLAGATPAVEPVS
ncbi:transcriptional regulator [Pseudoduganella albidiflava]|nr:transcriptional regulator [Pseudoduganella albidiflava]